MDPRRLRRDGATLRRGRYANYLNAEEVGAADAVSAAFGANWKRLLEVKRRYDPANVFHLNQNIKP